MKPAVVFGVVVRTIGLLICLCAYSFLFWAVINLSFGGPTSALALAIVGVLMLGVGLWLLHVAPSLIAIAFPNSRDRDGGDSIEKRFV